MAKQKTITADPTSRLQLLYDVSRELASALDLRTVLQQVLFLSIKHTGALSGSIIVMDENGEVTNWACEIGPNIPWLMREGWTRVRSEAALAPGTQATVTLTPAVSGEPVCLVNKIENEQGESVLLDFGLNRINVVKVVETR